MLRGRVVFIGGAIAPLLQTERVVRSPRVTKDVDGVVASASHSDFEKLRAAVRNAGFREVPGAHVHRWDSPDGDVFDLMPEGQHLGASGQRWDSIAIDCAVTLELAPELIVRHASASVFLALKLAAYHDRGFDSPLDSHDLTDVIALIVHRPMIIEEITASHVEVRTFVAAGCRTLLKNPDVSEILSAHLNNAYHRASAEATTLERLRRIASL